MKAAVLLMPLLVVGCQGTPRLYDGTLGYQVERRSDGLVVTYIEERRVSLKRHLLKVERACSEVLPGSAADILSRQDSEVQASGAVPVLAGHQNIGANAGYIDTDGMSIPVYHNERLLMTLKTRTVVALCRPG